MKWNQMNTLVSLYLWRINSISKGDNLALWAIRSLIQSPMKVEGGTKWALNKGDTGGDRGICSMKCAEVILWMKVMLCGGVFGMVDVGAIVMRRHQNTKRLIE